MKDYDTIGKELRTNEIDISDGKVHKKFRRPKFKPHLWYLERKPFQSVEQRFEREKVLVQEFYNKGLNVSKLLEVDDEKRVLVYKERDLTNLVDVFQDKSVEKKYKLMYFAHAVYQLMRVHALGRTHGDPLLKNFLRLNEKDERGPVFMTDFEYQRDSPSPQMTDIMILTANTIGILTRVDNVGYSEVFDVLKRGHFPMIKYPFALRDQLYFKMRFGMEQEFFKYFSRS